MDDRYFARSASNKTDDWPFGFVADRSRGGLNVTNELLKALDIPHKPGGVLGAQHRMETLAARANTELPS